MQFKLVLSFLLLSIQLIINAQDVLYTSIGTKISAKVIEINSTEVKYKDFTNLKGPTYIISKSEIIFIKFPNGTTEVLNAEPNTFSPQKQIQVYKPYEIIEPKKTEPLNLYYMNNNLLSINALALVNGDAAFIYDREFLKNRMSISFLGGYNFNARMGTLNSFIINSKESAKKNYDIGLGVNYMPSNTERLQYFVGFLGKYMSYSYKELVEISNNKRIYANASANQLSLMINNGFIYRISPFFNLKAFVSAGVGINSVPLISSNANGTSRPVNYSNIPKLYLGYCFGYRF